MEKRKEEQRSNTRPAVFMDRDGVLNRHFVREGRPCPPLHLEAFEILPGVVESCRKLKGAGYAIVVATNQPDIGRGTLSQDVVEEMHAFLRIQVPIDHIEICYHPGRGASNCNCRKPLPGMLVNASREFGLDLAQSWMVGDRFGDIACGKAAGCRTILVGDGYDEEPQATPDFRANDLAMAVEIILRRSTLT